MLSYFYEYQHAMSGLDFDTKRGSCLQLNPRGKMEEMKFSIIYPFTNAPVYHRQRGSAALC